MFFNKKKKPKLDPKVRFQNRQFNQKLQKARTFKRTTKPVSDSNVDRFLESIGLGSRLLQAGIVLLVLGILYLVYAPNFLTLQIINIEGASPSDTKLIEASIRDALGSAPFFNPQGNMAFLSTRRVEEAAREIPSVWEITAIRKNYATGSLNVSVISKYEKFLVRTGEHVFDVYNDGTLKGEAGVTREDWDSINNPNMIKIDIEARIPNHQAEQFFADSAVQYFAELQDNIKGIVGSHLKYLSLPNRDIKPADTVDDVEPDGTEAASNDPEQTEEDTAVLVGDTLEEEMADEIKVSPKAAEQKIAELPELSLPIAPGQLDIVMQKGEDAKRTFRVVVDTSETAHDAVQRLNMLLSQTDPERYNALDYIDLRVRSRAYICLLGTVCSN